MRIGKETASIALHGKDIKVNPYIVEETLKSNIPMTELARITRVSRTTLSTYNTNIANGSFNIDNIGVGVARKLTNVYFSNKGRALFLTYDIDTYNRIKKELRRLTRFGELAIGDRVYEEEAEYNQPSISWGTIIKCKSCGFELMGGRFCYNCGTKIVF